MLSIFKKKKQTEKNVNSNVQKLDKNQLEKVIGGDDGTDAEKRMHTGFTVTKGWN